VTGPPAEAFGVWLHSHEEDTGSATVYRPAGHPFPPSRGRSAVEIRPDGTYLEHDSGPDDRGRAVAGHWEVTGEGQVELTVTRADGSSATRRVASCADGVLTLEQVPSRGAR
jgi:hypothetical protein